MENLPVREIVLYKHGIGFFIRQGTVDGREATLTFRRDDINDVLKSLAVFDEAGGTILGIHYQTPMDTASRFASSSIELSERESLRDLLRDLRGRRCQLQIETAPGSLEMLIGRIIGLDEQATQKHYQAALAILTDDGVRIVALSAVQNILIEDEQSAHDLSFFLDTSMTEGDRRTIIVRLSEGQHQLSVYYVAPAPTWRVSYRLVASRGENGTGTALLQGWGLFDNRLDEDLNDIRVTFVAGQPISFIYDLYTSRIPERPLVRDEARVAPGPVNYADMKMMADEPPIPEEEPSFLRRRASRPMMAAAAAPRMEREKMEQSTPAHAQGEQAGETFQYQVTTPVTIKRGESALVPIISTSLRYERELLYNAAKLPQHPVAALRFANTTGLTLERGPVTLVEDGDYKGEAVIPFTRSDGTLYVPYAVELGIEITEKQDQQTSIAGIKLADQALFEQVYRMIRVVYSLNNRTDEEQIVTIEATKTPAYELYDTPVPDAQTAGEYRWKVTVPAQGQATLIRQERRLVSQRQDIMNLSYEKIAYYLRQNWIDDALHGRLHEILAVRQQITDARQRITNLENEREQIYAQQEQLRANLGALRPQGDEAALRSRILNRLEQTQDHLESIAAEMEQKQREIGQNLEREQALIDALTD